MCGKKFNSFTDSEYVSLLLLYFLNPVLTSLRSVQQASGLRNVQRKLGVPRASLGSLSEAQNVFDADLLGRIFQELAAETEAIDGHLPPSGLAKEMEIVAVDGSLLRALPRMVWALWQDPEHRRAKLHLEFNILKSVPMAAHVTDGNGSERQVLRDRLRPGKLYVLDAGFAQYALLEAIRAGESSFVARLYDNAVYEVIEEGALTEADRAAGVLFDRVVRLGCRAKRGDLSEPVRVVQIHVKSPAQGGLSRRQSRVSSKKALRPRPTEFDLLIVTDLLEPPAEVIGTLFRSRWTIELFFRWFKCVLGFGHLLSESQEGVQILVYCALIVSVLITLWTGRKPTKRTLEMIQLYFQGWAELDELEAHIASLERRTS